MSEIWMYIRLMVNFLPWLTWNGRLAAALPRGSNTSTSVRIPGGRDASRSDARVRVRYSSPDLRGTVFIPKTICIPPPLLLADAGTGVGRAGTAAAGDVCAAASAKGVGRYATGDCTTAGGELAADAVLVSHRLQLLGQTASMYFLFCAHWPKLAQPEQESLLSAQGGCARDWEFLGATDASDSAQAFWSTAVVQHSI